MIRFDRQTIRFWFMGQRIHHGLFGCFLVGFGSALIWHDRRDFPWL